MSNKAKQFIELQKAVNKQIDENGEADHDMVQELEKLGDSMNSHECEIAIEMWVAEKEGREAVLAQWDI